MADIINTLKQLEDAVRDVINLSLGIDLVHPDGSGMVRIAWPPDGAPAWQITDDIMFVKVSTVNDSYSKQRDVTYDPNTSSDVKATTCYTRVIRASITAYGPNSFDHLESVRSGFFSNAEELSKHNLYLVLDVTSPTRMPELFNGQWWDRSDLSLYLYEKVTKQAVVPAIGSANLSFLSFKETIVH